jgi:hypothetical protein
MIQIGVDFCRTQRDGELTMKTWVALRTQPQRSAT